MKQTENTPSSREDPRNALEIWSSMKISKHKQRKEPKRLNEIGSGLPSTKNSRQKKKKCNKIEAKGMKLRVRKY